MMDNRDISWDTQPTMSWCALKWEITPNKSNNGNFKRNMTINHVGLAFRQTHVYFYQNSRNKTSRDHMTLPPSNFLCHGEWLPICCLLGEMGMVARLQNSDQGEQKVKCWEHVKCLCYKGFSQSLASFLLGFIFALTTLHRQINIIYIYIYISLCPGYGSSCSWGILTTTQSFFIAPPRASIGTCLQSGTVLRNFKKVDSIVFGK